MLEGSLPHNPSGSQLGPISTSVMVAIAGEKSPVVQTRDIIGGGDVKGNNNKVSTNSPIHIGDSTMQKGYQPSERLLSMLLAFIFGVVFISALLLFVLIIPNPTDQQFEVIRIVLALDLPHRDFHRPPC